MIIMFGFTGLALGLGAEVWGGWMIAGLVADVALVSASAYSAYASAQQQRANAKTQSRIEQYQAQAYEMQAKDLERQAQMENEKAAMAQIQSEQEAERRSRTMAADIGSAYASAAGNGLLVNASKGDTFGHVLTSTVGEAQEDISNIRDNGRLSVWEHQSNAQSLLVSGQTSRISKVTSLIGASQSRKNAGYYNQASYLGAATGGLSSAASAVSVGFQGASYRDRKRTT